MSALCKPCPSGVSVTCGKCQHEADFMEFRETEVSGALPDGHMQCPSCKVAWKLEIVKPAEVFDDGFVIPAKKKVKIIPSVL